MKRTVEEGEASLSEKRVRGEEIGTASDVEEFFALLKRIEETQKQLGVLRRVNKEGRISSVSLDCSPDGCNMQGVMPKAVWRPSFSWEDFSGSGNGNGNGNENENGNGNGSGKGKGKGNENENRNSNEDENDKRNLPEIFNNDRKCMQRRCLRADQDYEDPRESLDLNLPFTPAGL